MGGPVRLAELLERGGRRERLGHRAAHPGRAPGRPVVARAKVGKSLLALDITTALATGRPLLGGPAMPAGRRHLHRPGNGPRRPAGTPRRPRLRPGRRRGHAPAALLPGCPAPPARHRARRPGPRGHRAALGARLVVIDTMARAVSGEENSADTYRRFYQFTGCRLRAAGCRCCASTTEAKISGRGSEGRRARTTTSTSCSRWSSRASTSCSDGPGVGSSGYPPRCDCARRLNPSCATSWYRSPTRRAPSRSPACSTTSASSWTPAGGRRRGPEGGRAWAAGRGRGRRSQVPPTAPVRPGTTPRRTFGHHLPAASAGLGEAGTATLPKRSGTTPRHHPAPPPEWTWAPKRVYRTRRCPTLARHRRRVCRGRVPKDRRHHARGIPGAARGPQTAGGADTQTSMAGRGQRAPGAPLPSSAGQRRRLPAPTRPTRPDPPGRPSESGQNSGISEGPGAATTPSPPLDPFALTRLILSEPTVVAVTVNYTDGVTISATHTK